MTKANLDKIKGRAGFYRSSRAVHAFDSDASITVSRSWGDSHCSPGDFVIVGAPKASTNWHNDVYVSVLYLLQATLDTRVDLNILKIQSNKLLLFGGKFGINRYAH